MSVWIIRSENNVIQYIISVKYNNKEYALNYILQNTRDLIIKFKKKQLCILYYFKWVNIKMKIFL